MSGYWASCQNISVSSRAHYDLIAFYYVVWYLVPVVPEGFSPSSLGFPGGLSVNTIVDLAFGTDRFEKDLPVLCRSLSAELSSPCFEPRLGV